MSLSDHVQEILPTRQSRMSALLTPPATAILWAIPHWASPLWPTLSQVEIMLIQAVTALSSTLLGTLATLFFVLAHQRTLTKTQPTETADAVKKQPEIKIALSAIQEKILVVVGNSEPIQVEPISRKFGIGQQVALHHLEAMKEIEFVSYYWRNKEWKLQPKGRAYLVSQNLIS